MNQGLRRAAIGIPGFCAFFNMYGPQSLLPSLAREFDASPAQISLTMTATIFAIAYIGEEWPAAEATGVTGVYMAATSVGGFCGRLFSGLLADTVGWRTGFVVTAALTLACGIAVAAILPRERNFTRSEGLAASAAQMVRHLRNPKLLATYAIGFGILFNFIALFTYVNFVLAAPPFNLSATFLGAIFVTYLAGSVAVLGLGRAVARFGRRSLVVGAIVAWGCGALLTLAPSLPVIVLGLAIAAGSGFIVQATATAYVALTAESGRTSAIGLYATTYYAGGSIGAVLPGLTWSAGGWPACIAMVVAMLVLMTVMIFLSWKR